jgi:hypothetical protein
MSDETPLTPEAEARFKSLAACVAPEDWDKLVTATTDRLLRAIGFTGAFDAASADQLAQVRQVIGATVVEYTNVTLTVVAQGDTRNP